MKILVIEDDVMLADSIRAMLEKRGLESNAVENHVEVYVAMLQPSIIYKTFKKSLWPYFSF